MVLHFSSAASLISVIRAKQWRSTLLLDQTAEKLSLVGKSEFLIGVLQGTQQYLSWEEKMWHMKEKSLEQNAFSWDFGNLCGMMDREILEQEKARIGKFPV